MAICYPGNKWREAVFFPDDQVSFEFQNQKGGGVGWYHLSEIKREKGMHDVGNFGIQFYLIV